MKLSELERNSKNNTDNSDDTATSRRLPKTPVCILNLSLDDNFANTSNRNIDTTPETDSNLQNSDSADDRNRMPFQLRRNISFNGSDESDSESSTSDEQMSEISTDSENENMPEIDYEEELRSRYHYYANLIYLTREVEGCENAGESVHYNIGVDELEYSEEDNRSVSHTELKTKDSSCSSTRSCPKTCSTMIRENSNSPNSRRLNYSASSTMAKEIVPFASSTIIEQTRNNSCRCCDSMDTILPDNAQETSTLLPRISNQCSSQDHSSCCPIDSLAAVASSLKHLSEVSCSDMSCQEVRFHNKLHLLRRTSTLYNLNEIKLRQEQQKNIQQPIESRKTKSEKHRTGLSKALQSVKSATKNLKKKSKNNEYNEPKQDTPEREMLELTLEEKRTVRKRFHRFRESFRRKDKKQFQTLANL